MPLLVDDDALHFGRRERIDDELRRILRPEDDVDALAGELVRHRSYARAAHADARALRIEPRIVRFDGDFRADAGITRGRLDLDQALLDLGHLELEQPHDELGRDARENQLRALRGAVDLHHVGTYPIAHAQHFLRNELIARNHAFDAARFDDHIAALDPLDGSREQIVVALEE